MAICRVLALAAVFGLASPVWAFEYRHPTVSYYAESVLTLPTRTVTVRTWYAPDKLKMVVVGNRQSMAMIADRVARSMTLLLLSDKRYFVRPLNPKVFGPMGRSSPVPGMIFTKVGAETVNDIKATKYKATGKMAGGVAFDGHIWLTADRIVVRMEGMQVRGSRQVPMKMEVSSLKVGPIDPAVYAIPKDYKKEGQ